jgi:hypothetical protein
VNAVKRVHWSTVGTEAHAVEVSGRQIQTIQKLSQQMDVSYSNYYNAVTNLKMFLYKVLVVQQLLPPDFEK